MRTRVPPGENTAERCYDTAVRMLQHRWHGREELRRKLSARAYSREVIDAAFERLDGEGWLDDRRFATALAESKIRKAHGHHRVEQELRASGVDAATAREVLRELVDEEEETARLAKLCLRKMRSLSPGKPEAALQDEAKRNKLTAYLLNQGYDYAAVEAALRQIARESESNAHHE